MFEEVSLLAMSAHLDTPGVEYIYLCRLALSWISDLKAVDLCCIFRTATTAIFLFFPWTSWFIVHCNFLLSEFKLSHNTDSRSADQALLASFAAICTHEQILEEL